MTQDSIVKSVGFGIREAGCSFCFYNPAARPPNLKFSPVGRERIHTLQWRCGEDRRKRLSEGTVLPKQLIPQSEAQAERGTSASCFRSLAPNCCLQDLL